MSSVRQIDGYKVYMNEGLGRGSFGSVYRGINDSTKEKVAVKILNKAESTPALIQFMLRSIWKMHSTPK